MNRLGYIHAVDVVPTFCHILGTPAPAQSQGTVARDLFKEYEMLRQREDGAHINRSSLSACTQQ